MKNFFLLALTMLTCVVTASAQDVLTKQNGEDMQVIVKEIDSSNVKYVLYSEPNGVLYVMPKSEVLMISYASGRREVFGVQMKDYEQMDPYATNYGGRSYIRMNMKYADLKNIYDYRDWRGGFEKYSPTWCGVASFFIPGLGQICAGEAGRGLGQWFVSALVNTCGLYALESGYVGSYLLCCCTSLGLGIWSIVDATRVAKVKNMYVTDLYSKQSVSVDLYPSLTPMQYSGSNLKVAPGMTLAVSF